MKWPEGWREVVLGDVCDINPRLAPEEKPAADTPVSFVGMSAVDETRGAITAPETRLFSEVQRGYTPFRDGDVLFAKVTPCMENGKAAIARNLENGIGFGSTEFHVLRPNLDLILPEYLFYFIRQPLFRTLAAASFMGTGGLQRVPADFFRRVKLPVPPLPEQRRIVEAFDELEDAARESASSAEKLAALARRRFLQMFGHPASNPKGFPKEPLGNLGKLDRGVSKHRPRDAAHLYGGPFPFIQTSARRRSSTSMRAFQTVWLASAPTMASPPNMSCTA
jgi:type I restriction enzyme S subunit